MEGERLSMGRSLIFPRRWAGAEWAFTDDEALLYQWSPFRSEKHVTVRFDQCGVSLDPRPLGRRRRWDWQQIAVVAWDGQFRGPPALALCLFGDRFPKPLCGAGWKPAIRERLLELLTPVVALYGAEVIQSEESASTWWDLDPRSRHRAQE
jgi:hypothetical protein